MPEKTRCGYDIASEVFVTKDEDPTGLLNEGWRYRDLETGTFITRDPLGFIDGPNMYSYVMANPWTYFDPQGLFKSFKGIGKKSLTDNLGVPKLKPKKKDKKVTNNKGSPVKKNGGKAVDKKLKDRTKPKGNGTPIKLPDSSPSSDAVDMLPAPADAGSEALLQAKVVKLINDRIHVDVDGDGTSDVNDIVSSAETIVNITRTETVENSGGDSVNRTYVESQDDLANIAVDKIGDDWQERKPGFWTSPDGMQEVEVSEGHSTTNEPAHVKVMKFDPDSGKKGRMRVTEKYFVDPKPNRDRNDSEESSSK